MPKVGRIRVVLNKDSSDKYYDLWYNQTEWFHLKGLPSDFLQLTEFKSEGWAAEIDLEKELNNAIEKYKQLLCSEKKVIIFRICASPILTMNKTGESSYTGTKKGIGNNISRFGFGNPECSIGIEYHLYKEINNGGKKYYPILEDGGTGYEKIITREYAIIEWTEQRQMFFDNVYSSMETLMLKLAQFFTDDIEKTTQLIDSSAGSMKFLS